MLKAWVISQVAGDGSEEDPWRSPVPDDFPVTWAPYELNATINSHISYTYEGAKGFLKAPIEHWTREIDTDGVHGCSDILASGYPISPPVAVVQCRCTLDVALDIHTSGGYLVLAAEDEETGESLDYNGTLWGKNDPINEWRWNQYGAGLIALGFPAETVNAWRTNNPEGTPTELFLALRNYINQGN